MFVINSVTRVNPPACDHWRVNATLDGNTFERTLTSGEVLENRINKEEFLRDLISYYLREKGYTKGSIVGKDMLRDNL